MVERDTGIMGMLHPGAMGAAVAAQAVAAGTTVRWLPAGRSAATRRRAEALGLLPAADLRELADGCGTLVSVCPPAAALDVAEEVAAAGFGGLYVDANAISPQRTAEIAEVLAPGGATVVDGGITGPPPRTAGTTRLYLSGDASAVGRVSALFAGTVLETVALDGPVGRASALKLAYAAYNKISHALAAQACALAAGHGVLDDLLALTAHTMPETPFGSPARLTSAGAKAWRWEGEMREIARTWQQAGLPTDFADAAAGTFARWTEHKDDPEVSAARLIEDLRTE
ncbi:MULTISPECIES: DUF1932 domain-containing protein [unclassified Streptomyces]|uniref:NAD(P)-dependent oxidoreductase n=1 Tax=unclassified Streptomyces TaxID=2593676 RepID=UPI00382B7A10